MKFSFVAVVIFLWSGLVFGQQLPPCPKNPDDLYDRGQTLQKLADALRNSIPDKYKTTLYTDFRVRGEHAVLFFVQDLTDLTNKQSRRAECVNFIDGHVYHFSSFALPFSFNHLAFLRNGELKIFRAINCRGMGDKLEDAIVYLEEKLKDDKDKAAIIERVKNYREFGWYVAIIDDTDLRCEEKIN